MRVGDTNTSASISVPGLVGPEVPFTFVGDRRSDRTRQSSGKPRSNEASLGRGEYVDAAVDVNDTWLQAGDPAKLADGVSGVIREAGVLGDRRPPESIGGGVAVHA